MKRIIKFFRDRADRRLRERCVRLAAKSQSADPILTMQWFYRFLTKKD